MEPGPQDLIVLLRQRPHGTTTSAALTPFCSDLKSLQRPSAGMDLESKMKSAWDEAARKTNLLESLSDHDLEVLFFAKIKTMPLGDVIESVTGK